MPRNSEKHGESKNKSEYSINQDELARYANLHQEKVMRQAQAELLRASLASHPSETTENISKNGLRDHLSRLEAIETELEELEETRPDPKKLN